MTSYAKWSDIRLELVERAGGEEVVEAGKREILARGLTQQPVAERRVTAAADASGGA